MKRFKPLIFVGVILSMLIMFIGINSSAVLAAQSEKEQDGLKVTMTTDKDDYGKEENIKATFDFQNNSEKTIKEIQLSNEVPAGYVVIEEELKQQIGDINPGETKQANATYVPVIENNEKKSENSNANTQSRNANQNPKDKADNTISSSNNGDKKMSSNTVSNTPVNRSTPVVSTNKATANVPSTGDKSGVPVWAIVAISASSVSILSYFVIKKKAGGRILSVVLCAGIAGASISGLSISKTNAEEVYNTESINMRTTINVDGEAKELSSDVAFTVLYDNLEEHIEERPDNFAGELTSSSTELILGVDDPNLYFYLETEETFSTIELYDVDGTLISAMYDDGIFGSSGDDLPGDNVYSCRLFVEATEADVNRYIAKAKKENGEEYLSNTVLITIQNNPEYYKDVLEEAPFGSNKKSEIIYAQDVIVTKTKYEVNEDRKIIKVFDTNITKNWNAGEIHVLNSDDEYVSDVGFRIASIEHFDNYSVIEYEVPDIDEMVDKIDYEDTLQDFMFIPNPEIKWSEYNESDFEASELDYGNFVEDENVTLSKGNTKSPYRVSRAAGIFADTSNWDKYALDGKTLDDLSGELSIGDNLQLKFCFKEVFAKTKINYHTVLGLPVLEEIGASIGSKSKFTIEAKVSSADKGFTNKYALTDLIKNYKKVDEFTFGRIQFFGGPIVLSGDLKGKVDLSGKITLSLDLDNEIGFYQKFEWGSLIKPVFRSKMDPSVALEGKLKIEAGPEVSVTFLGLTDIVSIGGRVGPNFKGELYNIDAPKREFCSDVSSYVGGDVHVQFLEGVVKLVPGMELALKLDLPKMWEATAHIEAQPKLKIVKKCTRDKTKENSKKNSNNNKNNSSGNNSSGGNNNNSSSDKNKYTGVLHNGSFEDNLSGWTTTGDVRTITQLKELKPTDLSRMAILTTGIGSKENVYMAGTEGSVLSQKIKVPKDANTINFSYDVISEEPMEYVGSGYDDKFMFNIISDSETNTASKESVNESVWLDIDIDFYEGDDTTYHTGWKTTAIDVTKYRGKDITIQFVVTDVGDSIYDTAAVVDNVYLK